MIRPVTSEQLNRFAAPVMGLVPTFPFTAEPGTSVMPDSDKITYRAACRRTTVDGPAAKADGAENVAASNIGSAQIPRFDLNNFFLLWRRIV
ncbi:MAG TPA: hypothetical protein VGC39_01720 [Candidatus Methylacidiphilales bacterium]